MDCDVSTAGRAQITRTLVRVYIINALHALGLHKHAPALCSIPGLRRFRYVPVRSSPAHHTTSTKIRLGPTTAAGSTTNTQAGKAAAA